MARIEDLLHHEIKHGTQRSVGALYAIVMAMRRPDDGYDWRPINRAIIDRWSMTGLDRVKRIAHSIFDALAKAGNAADAA